MNFFFLLAITITVVQQLQSVREDDGPVEICFRVTQGSIEANTDIILRGTSIAMDGSARGIFISSQLYVYDFEILELCSCVNKLYLISN